MPYPPSIRREMSHEGMHMARRLVPVLLVLGLSLALAPAASAQPVGYWTDDHSRQVRTYAPGSGRGVQIAVDLHIGMIDVNNNGPDPSDTTHSVRAVARCSVKGAKRCQLDRLNLGWIGWGVQQTSPEPGYPPVNSGTAGTARTMTGVQGLQDRCNENLVAVYVSVRNQDNTLSKYRLPTDPVLGLIFGGPVSGCS
jgi:hypothetical protein